jgi:hypothetical protein
VLETFVRKVRSGDNDFASRQYLDVILLVQMPIKLLLEQAFCPWIFLTVSI